MKKKRYIWCRCRSGDIVIVRENKKGLNINSFALTGSVCYERFRKVFPQVPKFEDGLKFKIDVTNAKVVK